MTYEYVLLRVLLLCCASGPLRVPTVVVVMVIQLTAVHIHIVRVGVPFSGSTCNEMAMVSTWIHQQPQPIIMLM